MIRQNQVTGLARVNVLAEMCANAQSRLCQRLVYYGRDAIHVSSPTRPTTTRSTQPPGSLLPNTLGIHKISFFSTKTDLKPIMGSHEPNGLGAGGATSIKIRKAEPSDAEQIAALGTAVFTYTFKASGCSDAQLQAYLDEAYTTDAILSTLTSSSYYTLVAVEPADPTTILGFALLNTASTEPVIEAGNYARPVELQRLYVNLHAHGRGIGKGLMAEAERIAREEWGKATMWLGVWERNSVAQGLYGKLGFTRVGEHVFDVGGDAQTDWILVKAL